MPHPLQVLQQSLTQLVTALFHFISTTTSILTNQGLYIVHLVYHVVKLSLFLLTQSLYSIWKVTSSLGLTLINIVLYILKTTWKNLISPVIHGVWTIIKLISQGLLKFLIRPVLKIITYALYLCIYGTKILVTILNSWINYMYHCLSALLQTLWKKTLSLLIEPFWYACKFCISKLYAYILNPIIQFSIFILDQCYQGGFIILKFLYQSIISPLFRLMLYSLEQGRKISLALLQIIGQWIIKPLLHASSWVISLYLKAAQYLLHLANTLLLPPIKWMASTCFQISNHLLKVCTSYIFLPVVDLTLKTLNFCIKACATTLKIFYTNMLSPLLNVCRALFSVVEILIKKSLITIYHYFIYPALYILQQVANLTKIIIINYIKLLQATWKPIINALLYFWQNLTLANIVYSSKIILTAVLHPFLGIAYAAQTAFLLPFICLSILTTTLTAPFFWESITKPKNTSPTVALFYWMYTSLSLSTIATLIFFSPKKQAETGLQILKNATLSPKKNLNFLTQSVNIKKHLKPTLLNFTQTRAFIPARH